MDSFKQLLGKNINEVSLDESPEFFIALLSYNSKHCGRRYPTQKFKLTKIDYFKRVPKNSILNKKVILI